jgi:nucleoside-diphosphate-sugar epimerase
MVMANSTCGTISTWHASVPNYVCSGRPVPIPVPGIQLTTLTHVEDVASMLAAVPGNEAAVGQHFNVCSDRCISFVGEYRMDS